MSTVVFMHIGSDTLVPRLMVASVRRHNPDFRIVQISDTTSPAIAGVDSVVRRPMSDPHIMLFRMQCFAALPTSGPSWYLDTDMLCNRPLVFEGEPQSNVAVCVREFGKDGIFNHQFSGVDLSEHRGKTVGALYPYIGCATRLDDCNFWIDCLAEMEALDPKYFNWFGDQEAIRRVVDSGRYKVSSLPESIYACPPGREAPGVLPAIFHYKGDRKHLMLARASEEGLF
ncbi:MAG: hypothetical protein ABI655_15600 [Phenylobacterium sp.]